MKNSAFSTGEGGVKPMSSAEATTATEHAWSSK